MAARAANSTSTTDSFRVSGWGVNDEEGGLRIETRGTASMESFCSSVRLYGPLPLLERDCNEIKKIIADEQLYSV